MKLPCFSNSTLPRLWFLAKNKNADAKRGFRDRRQQKLFIYARKLGTLIDRDHREQNKLTTMRHVLY